MGPPTFSSNPRTSRQSIAGTMNGLAKAPSETSSNSSKPPTHRMSIRPSTMKDIRSDSGKSQATAGSGHDSPSGILSPEILSPPVMDGQDDGSRNPLSSSLSLQSSSSDAPTSAKPASSRGRSPPPKIQRATAVGATHREVEDLKTKLRVMEKKRVEDREKLKTLERLQSERDKFEGIIQKLQSKYQPQQQELTDLKKQLAEEETKVQAIEAQQAENDTMGEMATLDKEMAEETAESLKTELDALRQKNEEMELEIEILREENQELGTEMSPEEKASQGWLQMERSNERLREALMRLRDITQQQESDLKQQVQELEKDVQDLGNVKEEYLQTKERLAHSDAAVEDLRQQLDTALGAEEMIEELADKNMALNEQVDNLRAAIEDLESLKELNDELDLNHTETEKQLQDEINYNESVMLENARKAALQDETIQDLEYTVARFRDLVTNMQSDLEDMRASQQITETEASDLTNRSRAMMDLNLRLQVSASKAQVKAIDLELRKMEAQEIAEHLAIIQLFLPEQFKIERDSIRALLRFKRIGFKANLMHGYIKERLNSQASPGHEDGILACCDLLDKLSWISSICDRFTNSIHCCTLEAFLKLEGALYDLEPVERAFNGWIEALKSDELKEGQCVEDLQRTIALMTHLAEVHISDGLERYADDIHMRALMMQSHLESAAFALSYVKSISQAKILPHNCDETKEDEESQGFLQKVDSLISQTRSAKVVTSKAIRELEELKSRSLTLDPSTLPNIQQSQDLASDFALATRTAGDTVSKLLSEEDRNIPFTYREIARAMTSSDTLPFSTLSTKLHTTVTHLQNFYSLTSSLTQTVEFSSPLPPPPWQILAQTLRAASTTSASHETEMLRLRDEVVERNTALAMKDKMVEEMGVKVEVLEKRVGESSGRREKVRELETIAGNARLKEKELVAKLTRAENDLHELEVERESWKDLPQLTHSAQPNGQVPSPTTRDFTSKSALVEIATLKSEISSLQSSIRFLRSQSHTRQLSTSLAFLSEPITAPQPSSPTLLQQEAHDVVKEMLGIVTSEANTVVELRERKREERLAWRPVREMSSWNTGRMREEWEGWREWMDSVGKKRVREEGRRKVIRSGGDAKGDGLASLQVRLPGIRRGKMGEGRELKIVRPGEWDDVREELGIA